MTTADTLRVASVGDAQISPDVSVASVSNLISFYSTSLYQDLIHAEFGLPWDDYEILWRWSPLRYARQVQTPPLLLHGDQDISDLSFDV